jgi:hypothetical protein
VVWEDRLQEYAKYNDEPAPTLGWKKRTLKAPDANVIGRYKNDLTSKEIARFEEIAGSTLERHGYNIG